MERNIPQADLAALVVHRINLKLPFVNRQLHTDRQIVFSLVFVDKAVRSVLVFAHQHKVLTVRPNLLAVVNPLICRESRYRNTLAAFKLLFQNLSAKQIRNGFGILTVELDIAVMLKSDKHRYLILFTDFLILGFACSIQHRRLFFCFRFIGFYGFFRNFRQVPDRIILIFKDRQPIPGFQKFIRICFKPMERHTAHSHSADFIKITGSQREIKRFGYRFRILSEKLIEIAYTHNGNRIGIMLFYLVVTHPNGILDRGYLWFFGCLLGYFLGFRFLNRLFGSALHKLGDKVVIQGIFTEQVNKILGGIGISKEGESFVRNQKRTALCIKDFMIFSVNVDRITYGVVIYRNTFHRIVCFTLGNDKLRATLLRFDQHGSGRCKQAEIAVFVFHNIGKQTLHTLIAFVRFVYAPNDRGHIRYYVFKPFRIVKPLFYGFYHMEHIRIFRQIQCCLISSGIKAVDALCKHMTFINGHMLIVFFFEVSAVKNNVFYTLCRLLPTEECVRCFLFAKTATSQLQTFSVMVGMAVICSAESMGTATDTITVSDKICLFFCGMVLNKERIGRKSAVRIHTAAHKIVVDFVLGYKIHVGTKVFHRGKRKMYLSVFKLGQATKKLLRFMEVEAQYTPIFLILHNQVPKTLNGIGHKGSILQQFRNMFGTAWKTSTEQFFVQEIFHVAILMQIPQRLCYFQTLIGNGLIQDHLGSIIAAMYQLLCSFSNLLPGQSYGIGRTFSRLAFCKFHSVLIKPNGIRLTVK